jgi:hypothetical protein
MFSSLVVLSLAAIAPLAHATVFVRILRSFHDFLLIALLDDQSHCFHQYTRWQAILNYMAGRW